MQIGNGGVPVDLSLIGSSQIRLGSAAGSITASSIILTSDFDAAQGNGARPLDLRANGDITDGGNALLNVTTLTGVSNTGSVVFANVNNTVTALGDFSAKSAFTLVNSTDLTLSGVLNAGGPIALTAPSISVPGSITTGGSRAARFL